MSLVEQLESSVDIHSPFTSNTKVETISYRSGLADEIAPVSHDKLDEWGDRSIEDVAKSLPEKVLGLRITRKDQRPTRVFRGGAVEVWSFEDILKPLDVLREEKKQGMHPHSVDPHFDPLVGLRVGDVDVFRMLGPEDYVLHER